MVKADETKKHFIALWYLRQVWRNSTDLPVAEKMLILVGWMNERTNARTKQPTVTWLPLNNAGG